MAPTRGRGIGLKYSRLLKITKFIISKELQTTAVSMVENGVANGISHTVSHVVQNNANVVGNIMQNNGHGVANMIPAMRFSWEISNVDSVFTNGVARFNDLTKEAMLQAIKEKDLRFLSVSFK